MFFVASHASQHVAVGNDAVPGTAKKPATFPVEYTDAVFVPSEIFGDQVEALLSTTASRSLLDDSYRQHLGKSTGQENVKLFGLLKTDLYQAPELKILSDEPHVFHAADSIGCVNLENLRGPSGHDKLRIVLARDFLRTQILYLNFDEGLAQLRTQTDMKQPHIERIEMRNGNPNVVVTIAEDDLTGLIVDTGFNGNLQLELEYYHQLVQRRRIVSTNKGASVSQTATGVSLKLSSAQGILKCLQLGPHKFHNVRVSSGTRNCIGTRFLAKFLVELDVAHLEARFLPSQRIGLADLRDRSGLGIERENGKTVVRHPPDDSSGENATICKGDEVLRINDIEVSQMPLAKLRVLLCEPGADVSLLIRRDQTDRTVKLRLSNEPDPFPATAPYEFLESGADFDQ